MQSLGPCLDPGELISNDRPLRQPTAQFIVPAGSREMMLWPGWSLLGHAGKPQAGSPQCGRAYQEGKRLRKCANCLVQPTTYCKISSWFSLNLCFRTGKSRKGHLLLSVSDPGEDEHSNANHYHSHHNPKNNQPYGDSWLVRGFQCGLNTQKLQAVVIQAKSIINAAPGLPIHKSKTLREKEHLGKIKWSVIIYSLYCCF